MRILFLVDIGPAIAHSNCPNTVLVYLEHVKVVILRLLHGLESCGGIPHHVKWMYRFYDGRSQFGRAPTELRPLLKNHGIIQWQDFEKLGRIQDILNIKSCFAKLFEYALSENKAVQTSLKQSNNVNFVDSYIIDLLSRSVVEVVNLFDRQKEDLIKSPVGKTATKNADPSDEPTLPFDFLFIVGPGLTLNSHDNQRTDFQKADEASASFIRLIQPLLASKKIVFTWFDSSDRMKATFLSQSASVDTPKIFLSTYMDNLVQKLGGQVLPSCFLDPVLSPLFPLQKYALSRLPNTPISFPCDSQIRKDENRFVCQLITCSRRNVHSVLCDFVIFSENDGELRNMNSLSPSIFPEQVALKGFLKSNFSDFVRFQETNIWFCQEMVSETKLPKNFSKFNLLMLYLRSHKVHAVLKNLKSPLETFLLVPITPLFGFLIKNRFPFQEEGATSNGDKMTGKFENIYWHDGEFKELAGPVFSKHNLLSTLTVVSNHASTLYSVIHKQAQEKAAGILEDQLAPERKIRHLSRSKLSESPQHSHSSSSRPLYFDEDHSVQEMPGSNVSFEENSSFKPSSFYVPGSKFHKPISSKCSSSEAVFGNSAAQDHSRGEINLPLPISVQRSLPSHVSLEHLCSTHKVTDLFPLSLERLGVRFNPDALIETSIKMENKRLELDAAFSNLQRNRHGKKHSLQMISPTTLIESSGSQKGGKTTTENVLKDFFSLANICIRDGCPDQFDFVTKHLPSVFDTLSSSAEMGKQIARKRILSFFKKNANAYTEELQKNFLELYCLVFMHLCSTDKHSQNVQDPLLKTDLDKLIEILEALSFSYVSDSLAVGKKRQCPKAGTLKHFLSNTLGACFSQKLPQTFVKLYEYFEIDDNEPASAFLGKTDQSDLVPSSLLPEMASFNTNEENAESKTTDQPNRKEDKEVHRAGAVSSGRRKPSYSYIRSNSSTQIQVRQVQKKERIYPNDNTRQQRRDVFQEPLKRKDQPEPLLVKSTPQHVGKRTKSYTANAATVFDTPLRKRSGPVVERVLDTPLRK